MSTNIGMNIIKGDLCGVVLGRFGMCWDPMGSDGSDESK